jgi:hypothetical protein
MGRSGSQIMVSRPEAHSHHGANSEGNKCVACHMPQIATTIADVNVRSHTFNFISPSMTDNADPNHQRPATG